MKEIRFVGASLHSERSEVLHLLKSSVSIPSFSVFSFSVCEVFLMRSDPPSIQSMDFAVSIINLVKELKEKRESIISNQIGRSGTSIGANIREAQYATEKRILFQSCKSY